MKSDAIGFVTGLLFAFGLAIAGMTQPQKVLGWLNFFGDWDPTLAFVMVGAILVNGSVYTLIVRHRSTPVLGGKFLIPSRKDIDPRLILGTAMFGVGWGLAGYCPGPALVSLFSGQTSVLIFVVAMVAGMWAFRVYDHYHALWR